MYTLNELSSTLTVHTLPTRGDTTVPEAIARFSTLTPEDQPHASKLSTAEIILLPSLDGQNPMLLMCSNRDSPSPTGDTVALFSVDPEDGAKVQRTEQGWLHGCGKHLRGMQAEPTGRFVVVSARDGGGVTIVERGGGDGLVVKEVARLEGDGAEKVVAPIWIRS